MEYPKFAAIKKIKKNEEIIDPADQPWVALMCQ
jgi:hypothetical protein